MAVIQWYPGHMAKTMRLIKDNLKLVDIILELVDARIPMSSRNPMVEEVSGNKSVIIVLTKSDLADPIESELWINYYEKKAYPTVLINNNRNDSLKKIENKINVVMKEKINKKIKRGINNYSIKAMCLGIPNVGKSTLLNHFLKKNVAKTGNSPGITKSQQWLKSNNFQLLDTPGILWPKFENPIIGKKLALTGAIKDNLYNKDDIALFALEYFKENSYEKLKRLYNLTDNDLADTAANILINLTQKMGFKDNYERAGKRLIMDIRKGKLGRYTLDKVSNINEC